MSTFDVRSPFDQSVIKSLPTTTREEAHAALDQAHQLYRNRAGWLTAARRIEILKQLIVLGANRVLSSGGKPTAIEGLPVLTKLQEAAEEKISIMPGGGINSGNAQAFSAHGFDAVHLSAIAKPPSTSLFDNAVHGVSDVDEIRKVVRILS